MIRFFKIWGKPLLLRVDNGSPFGSAEPSTTSALALKLIAYGVLVHTNKPHTPQQNAKVERQQGTSIRWAEVEKCPNLVIAQKYLDEACQIQRERYPVSRLKGKTRLEVFPQLKTNPRVWQEQDCDIQRVYDFLAKKKYVRKVSSNGQITLFEHKYAVGSQFKAQSVLIKLDTFTLNWEIYQANGDFIRAWSAKNLTVENVLKFTVFSKNAKAVSTLCPKGST